MSDFVPNSRHLREVLFIFFFFFHSKKMATETHRELQKVYGDAALIETRCRKWFRRFKDVTHSVRTAGKMATIRTEARESDSTA